MNGSFCVLRHMLRAIHAAWYKAGVHEKANPPRGGGAKPRTSVYRGGRAAERRIGLNPTLITPPDQLGIAEAFGWGHCSEARLHEKGMGS